MKQAICQLSAIPMRFEPSDRSEMVNQILFGESMDILDANEKWYMVRLHHDQYEGWVDKKQIALLPENYDTPELNTVTAPLLVVQNQSGGFNFIPAGSRIHVAAQSIQAGGTTFMVSDQEVKNAIAPAEIALGAMIFLDTPYLWGGRTLMGIDCSGFTQLVYRMAGHFIPRDAHQQATIGQDIAFLEEAQTGDLAFFDNAEGKITHVGIVISQKEGSFKSIIHASGKVRMDQLDNQGIHNLDLNQYTHKLRMIKRIV